MFASCQASARKLAYAIGNGNVPVGPEKHGGLGYFGTILHIDMLEDIYSIFFNF